MMPDEASPSPRGVHKLQPTTNSLVDPLGTPTGSDYVRAVRSEVQSKKFNVVEIFILAT
jgi:hypothetical protein